MNTVPARGVEYTDSHGGQGVRCHWVADVEVGKRRGVIGVLLDVLCKRWLCRVSEAIRQADSLPPEGDAGPVVAGERPQAGMVQH